MDDDELIPISALQHYLYCPRQCALIHIERMWAENSATAEGRLLHARADTVATDRRKTVRIVTAMPLMQAELGLVGVADVVEFHGHAGTEQPVLVEYKRGIPKAHRADEVQLCAQALCLEYMLGQDVPVSYLFYGKTRRRKEVIFDATLRALTRNTVSAAREMILSGRTPVAAYESKRCDQCSLIELCKPRLLAAGTRVDSWLRDELGT